MNQASTIPTRARALICLAILLLLAPSLAEAGKEPKKRVAVYGFENRTAKSNWEQRQIQQQMGNLGYAMAEKLMESLNKTGKFVVLDRLALGDVLAEQNLHGTAEAKPGEESRLTSAQAVIRGVITNVEVIGDEEGGLGFKKLNLNFKTNRVSIRLNIRIVDTTTGQVLQSQSVEGVAKKRGAGLSIQTEKLKTGLEGNRTLPLGKAADMAVEKAVEKIVSGMERIPWQGRVARVTGRHVYINAGRQENVEPGLRLRVFQEGARIIDPETNEDLGTRDEEIGIVEVEDVHARFAVAKVTAGQGFARGNIVRPAPELE